MVVLLLYFNMSLYFQNSWPKSRNFFHKIIGKFRKFPSSSRKCCSVFWVFTEKADTFNLSSNSISTLLFPTHFLPPHTANDE